MKLLVKKVPSSKFRVIALLIHEKKESVILFDLLKLTLFLKFFVLVKVTGTWNLELGTWNLELGTWNLELGTWNLELGTWNLELGTS